MSRYDKYDPKVGGYRAPLHADWAKEDINLLVGVGLDANGETVKGAGADGSLSGVMVLTKARKAGEVIDIMTSGECVEFGEHEDEPTPTPGTKYYADPVTGLISTTATGVYVGRTVEADRLIVRFSAEGVA